MEINKKQALLLGEVAKQNGKKSISEIGRSIYHTNVTIYNNIYMLRDMGFITLTRKKNKTIPELTELGRMYVDSLYEVHKTLYQIQ